MTTAGSITENEEWLARLRASSDAAIGALRERIRAGLGAALAARWGVSDADLDDMTQDALLRVLGQLDSFRGESRFTTWAMAVAVRVALTTLRKRRWQARPLAELAVEPAAPPGESAPRRGERSELLAVLRAAISDDLSARQREAVEAELGGEPTVELAARLSTTTGAVYKLIHDARKKLKSALARSGFDAESIGRVLDGGG